MIRFIWIAGIISLVVVTIKLERAFAQPPEPGAYYSGAIATCTSSVFSLSPSFSLTIGPSGHINSMQFTVAALGPFEIPVDIPIASDGSFSVDFTPLNFSSGPIVATAHVEGRFEGNGVSGSYRFSVNVEVLGSASCAGTLQAERSTQPPPTPTATPAAAVLPSTGTGEASRHAASGQWHVLVLVVGATALASAFLLRRVQR